MPPPPKKIMGCNIWHDLIAHTSKYPHQILSGAWKRFWIWKCRFQICCASQHHYQIRFHETGSFCYLVSCFNTVTVILYCSSPSTSALNQWTLAIRSQLIHIIVLYAYVHSSHVALVGFSDFLHHLLLCSCTSLDGARHCDGPLWVVQGQVLETGPDRGRNMRTTVLTL